MSLRSSRKGRLSTCESTSTSHNNASSSCDKEDENEEPVQRPELLRITRATATTTCTSVETKEDETPSGCPFEETHHGEEDPIRLNNETSTGAASPTNSQEDKKNAQSGQATVSRFVPQIMH